jgi:L-glyceraldehyde 3-phosphate reductase
VFVAGRIETTANQNYFAYLVVSIHPRLSPQITQPPLHKEKESTMPYLASDSRYSSMLYNRTGNSGLKLPAISLGWWYNFGGRDTLENGRAIARRAFDMGVTHFDLANNYGPPPGTAEVTFGTLYKQDFHPYRDELIISTKAGYDMWPGPYGEWGSRKYMLASLDASLKRMGLEYVDIFYSHRFDPDTPLEETMGALDTAVRQGKALYVGISSYNPEQTRRAAQILKQLGTPCLIHQPSYNMFDRWVEDGLLDVVCRGGYWLYRLLASRAGTADRPLPERNPRWSPRHENRTRVADAR